MSNSKNVYRLVALLGVVLVAAVAIQVYADCGKCGASGKSMAGELKTSKMTLAAAATLAEVSTKGTAVLAMVYTYGQEPFVEVHCMVENKIMGVEVSIRTGKILKSKQLDTLAGHVSALPKGARGARVMSPFAEQPPKEAMPTPAEAMRKAPSLLNQANSAIEAGNLSQAKAALNKLEKMRSILPASTQKQIDEAQAAYNAARLSKD